MASYAAVADVLYPFPRFQQSLPNNISNAGIQAWIDEGKAVIRARFLRRLIDPDNPASLGWTPPLAQLTMDQASILRRFNKSYAIAEFGGAAFTQLNDGELKLVKSYKDLWDSMTKDTDGASSKYVLGNDGAFDALFVPSAAHVDTAPMLAGWAGADFNPELVNNHTQGTFFMFEKGMKF